MLLRHKYNTTDAIIMASLDVMKLSRLGVLHFAITIIDNDFYFR